MTKNFFVYFELKTKVVEKFFQKNDGNMIFFGPLFSIFSTDFWAFFGPELEDAGVFLKSEASIFLVAFSQAKWCIDLLKRPRIAEDGLNLPRFGLLRAQIGQIRAGTEIGFGRKWPFWGVLSAKMRGS